jgi:hypothetical protein
VVKLYRTSFLNANPGAGGAVYMETSRGIFLYWKIFPLPPLKGMNANVCHMGENFGKGKRKRNILQNQEANLKYMHKKRKHKKQSVPEE